MRRARWSPPRQPPSSCPLFETRIAPIQTLAIHAAYAFGPATAAAVTSRIWAAALIAPALSIPLALVLWAFVWGMPPAFRAALLRPPPPGLPPFTLTVSFLATAHALQFRHPGGAGRAALWAVAYVLPTALLVRSPNRYPEDGDMGNVLWFGSCLLAQFGAARMAVALARRSGDEPTASV